MGNKSLEGLKYLGTALTNQNALLKEITEGLPQGVLVIVWCRIFCLPFCYWKI